MKTGLIMPICTKHDMQVEAWTTARQFSKPDTPLVLLLNGITPFELGEDTLPSDAIIEQRVGRFPDECDLWQWCLEYAQSQGWDWCMVIHDDFAMREPGWEDDLAQSEGWRVCLASWCVYSEWDGQAVSRLPTTHHLGVTLDSFSFGFKVDVFAKRGYVANTRFGYGYGAWDSCAWALQNDYGIWRIALNSDHHWNLNNTRSLLNVGAPGHPEIGQRFGGVVLPATTPDQHHIQILDRIVRIAPDGAAEEPARDTTTRIDWGTSFVVTDGKVKRVPS